MRAFLVTSRGVGEVADVPAPTPGEGQAVVTIARAGICGTDVGLFNADKARLEHARTTFPLRLGHEWAGAVSRVGVDVDESWLGKRVTGDTMLGCGTCYRCQRGNHHVCENRYEIGVRGGWPGALAQELLIPVSALHPLPEQVTDAMGAMVEPGGNAWRAVAAAETGPGKRLLVLGPGTIGLLCGLFATAAGAEVHVMGRGDMRLAATLGFEGVWTADDLPALPWDAGCCTRPLPKPAVPAWAGRHRSETWAQGLCCPRRPPRPPQPGYHPPGCWAWAAPTFL